MTPEEIKAMAVEVSADVQKLIDKQAEEIKNLGKEHTETKTELKNATDKAVELQKQVDQLDLKIQTNHNVKPSLNTIETLGQRVITHAGWKDYIRTARKGINLEIAMPEMGIKGIRNGEFKTVQEPQSPTEGGSEGSFYYAPPGAPRWNPYTIGTRLRTLCQNFQTTSHSIPLPVQTGETNAVAVKAETDDTSVKFGQSDAILATGDFTVVPIGGIITFHRASLEDNPNMMQFVINRLMDEYVSAENAFIHHGTTWGLATKLTALADPGNFGTDIYYHEIISAAIAQIWGLKYTPDAILLNPAEFAILLLEKGADTLFFAGDFAAGVGPSIMGVPVYMCSDITAGSLTVVSMRQTSIFERVAPIVEFSYEAGTSFEDLEVVARVYSRLAFAVDRGKCGVYGTFAAALACGSA